MVDHGAPVRDGRLRGGGVETSVDLERVAADDLRVERSGQSIGQLGLAGARRTDDDQQPQRRVR
jgi:hypothetical protein